MIAYVLMRSERRQNFCCNYIEDVFFSRDDAESLKDSVEKMNPTKGDTSISFWVEEHPVRKAVIHKSATAA